MSCVWKLAVAHHCLWSSDSLSHIALCHIASHLITFWWFCPTLPSSTIFTVYPVPKQAPASLLRCSFSVFYSSLRAFWSPRPAFCRYLHSLESSALFSIAFLCFLPWDVPLPCIIGTSVCTERTWASESKIQAWIPTSPLWVGYLRAWRFVFHLQYLMKLWAVHASDWVKPL